MNQERNDLTKLNKKSSTYYEERLRDSIDSPNNRKHILLMQLAFGTDEDKAKAKEELERIGK